MILQDVDKTLHIKGQMIFIPEWQQMLFLACPIMKDLNSLIWCGLFVNDLRFFISSFFESVQFFWILIFLFNVLRKTRTHRHNQISHEKTLIGLQYTVEAA